MSSFKFANRNNDVKKNISSKKYTMKETFMNIASGITGFFVFIILTVFPLYTHDMYFDILGARYMFFKVWVILLAVLLVLLGLIYLVVNREFIFSDFKFKNAIMNFKKHLIITDYFFFAMLLVCIISTCLSDFKEESFYGNSGRYQGLECWILYFISYICITRTYKFKRWHLDFALLAGAFSCIWGVLDFLWLDPFGFFRNVNGNQHSMFASSIGNLNTFTNYTIIIFALAGVLFIKEKKPIRTVFYTLMSLCGMAGCIFGLADNAVLGLFAFYLFVPFFSLKNRRDLVRYLLTIDFLFIVLFFFWIAMKAPSWNRWQSSFFRDLLAHKEAAFAFIPFTILIAFINFILFKMKPNYGTIVADNLNPMDSLLPKTVKIVYTVIVCIGFATVTYIILDMNVFKQHVELWRQLPSSHQLIFDDNWGTHRGHNWRIAFTNFTQNFNIWQKLFGYGPDTYLVVSERTFYKEMVEKYGEVYDSAHNEYINYLICEGILGLIAYLGTFISGILIATRYIKKNILLLAPIIAVICYMVQAIVNIAIPITTPVFFTLMYIGVAYHFETKRESNE